MGAIFDSGCPPFPRSVCHSVRHSVRHNFVSTQYHENNFIELYQIFVCALLFTLSRLGLLHIIFGHFYQSYSSRFTPEFHMHSY